MPRLLIERSILKSRMNREVHVRFCEEQGVKFPLLTRLYAYPSYLSACFTLSVLPARIKKLLPVRWARQALWQVGFVSWICVPANVPALLRGRLV
jgi:hypothetical protein